MFVGSKKLTFPTIPCRTSANRCFVVLGWLGYFAVHSARVSLAAKGWWSAFAVAQVDMAELPVMSELQTLRPKATQK